MAGASLAGQAATLEYLIRRAGGAERAGEAWLLLTAPEIEELKHIAARLMRMAPHETAIRNIVTRGR